ncbi:C40 family peptidase [Streptomyces roseoverticillatus]|uniref:C40 family peptidase n=1 Tax=Streptomyces roseoverticillatus TaxID=66429 RepID=UPI001F43A6A5|nr:C40 family peptidase [Streptomyces roseoverticillatus]MCF3104232.1 C40 family peptidase [Streptomyces roseoverticillatus]
MASHRRSSQSGLTQTVRVTVLSAAVATAAAAMAPPAVARPGDTARDDRSGGTVKSQVDRLYEQAERATEKFNQAGERAGELRRKVADATDRVARGQERVNHMRTALGMIAAAQYRSGAVDPALQLLLSSDPDGYLERAATLDRVSDRQSEQLKALLGAQRSLRQERTEAARMLGELEDTRKAVEHHKRDVESKLATARRLLNALPEADRRAYARASRSGGTRTLDRSGGDGLLGGLQDLTAASGRGAAAAMAVRSAVGSPYAWGASGPGAFDCSGLMQWAYGRAGVGLPRTSQAQRNAGRHVPLSEARPGDLVIYRDDASHVGMYVGNGQVIHAPYPGARVRYDPANMMPISSVTRP